MKKALVVLLALAVVASGFAQPVADVNVAEFSGNASVTWGVDLDDDNATGFKNETEAKVVVNIFDAAEQSTEGDGIWAELVIKTDALKIVNEGKEGKFDTGDDGIRIDTAKLHFNDLYVGIQADGTKVGEFHLPRALNFEKIMTVPGVGPDRAAGIVAGYDSDLFSVAVDFRSAKAKDEVKPNFEDLSDVVAFVAAVTEFDATGEWTDADGTTYTDDPSLHMELFMTEAVDGVSQYSNDYAIRAVAKVTPIENLDTYVGFSYAFEKATGAKKNQMGFGANVLYKYELNDTFYLQPGVGYSSTFAEVAGETDKGTLGASLLFGFAGDPSDVGIGILDTAKDFYKFAHAETFDDITDFFAKANDDDKEYKWVADANAGVSVSTMLDLNKEGDAQYIPLFIDFNLGDALVENLGAVAFVRTADVKNFTDFWALGVGVNYVLNADPAEVTLKAGLLQFNVAKEILSAEAASWTQVEFGAEVGGLINNTTFSASYVSGNLTQSDDAGTTDPTFKNGTINLTCKIAL